MILATYVDDLYLFYDHKQDSDWVYRKMSEKYEISDLGHSDSYLGVEVQYDEEGVVISQGNVVEAILKKCLRPSSEIKPRKVPMSTDHKIPPSQPPLPTETPLTGELLKDFQRIVGTAMYLSTRSRPDISYCCSVLATHMARPCQRHLDCAYYLVGYLKATKSFKLDLTPRTKPAIKAYSDSSHGSLYNLKSQGAWTIQLGGATVDWRSYRIRSVCTSSSDAEYMCVSDLGKNALYFRNLIQEVGMTFDEPAVLEAKLEENTEAYCDNVAAIKWCYGSYNRRQRHVALAYHWVKDAIRQGMLRVLYTSGKSNPSDLLTKALPYDSVAKYIRWLGLAPT